MNKITIKTVFAIVFIVLVILAVFVANKIIDKHYTVETIEEVCFEDSTYISLNDSATYLVRYDFSYQPIEENVKRSDYSDPFIVYNLGEFKRVLVNCEKETKNTMYASEYTSLAVELIEIVKDRYDFNTYQYNCFITSISKL